MGQMRQPDAIPVLERVLRDMMEAPIVRHEAGEALNAIGDFSAIPLLEEFAEDEFALVAVTCRLAADGLIWQQENGTLEVSKANSVNPAPPEESQNVEFLKTMLLNTELTFFKRYRAMFALQDLNTVEAVEALSASFSDGSALLKHEVCFALGQMQNAAAIEPLATVLRDQTEHEVVRHEAAEALGNIATGTQVGEFDHSMCLEILKPFATDNAPVVAQSVDVALGIAAFWQDPDAL